MPTATLPRSAQPLAGAERPTLAQVRVLRRVATQDVEERNKLQALLTDGIPGVKDKWRTAALAFALGKFSDAEELIDAKEPAGQALLGLINAELGEYGDAKVNFLAAAKSVPEAKGELVRALLDAGEDDAAEKALAGLPEGVERDFLNGRLLESRSQIEAAIKAYEAALEADPQNVEAAFKIGVLLDRIGDDDLAAEHYLVCADATPPYLPAVTNLGILYEERGESNAALDCFRQVLAYNPRDRRALTLLRDAKASRTMYYDEREERERERMEKIMRTSVNDFELSVRSRNCLAKMNIFTLGDLLRITEQEMLSYKNFGETSLKEVKEMLAARNLRLGMFREGDERSISKADQKILGESVEKLELSTKSAPVLENLGVSRIGDLAQYTDLDLYRAPGSGQSVVQELATALGAYGVAVRKPEIKL
ncbi:MAG: tetratricopeptide repeat protein [Planctomycetes bacterium]|nr:tetratricopeptide repeat protein [Planctomycetota bacterium]